jgi:hypothetical protein
VTLWNRTLEQLVNANDLPEDVKINLQALPHRLLRSPASTSCSPRRGINSKGGSGADLLPE